MPGEIYRYVFSADVPIEEIEISLLLAVMGTESLHGESVTRLDASHYFDLAARTCVVDAGTAAGRDFSRLLIGIIRREFGEDAFRVQRVDTPAAAVAA